MTDNIVNFNGDKLCLGDTLRQDFMTFCATSYDSFDENVGPSKAFILITVREDGGHNVTYMSSQSVTLNGSSLLGLGVTALITEITLGS